jgi:hypothetical protein
MVCSSFNVTNLKNILTELEKIITNKLNIELQIPDKKEPRPNICLKIEFILRLLNEYTEDVWFYEGFFTEDKQLLSST